MKKINLTKGQYAIVDDEDYPFLSQWKWSLGAGYARRGVTVNGKIKSISMHKELIESKKGYEIDHINGDKLDNRKCNLRVCLHSENCKNRKMQKNNVTGYKGVSVFIEKRCKNISKTIFARIKVNGSSKYLGTYKTLEKAALAYNKAAIKYFGEFAKLNKVREVIE